PRCGAKVILGERFCAGCGVNFTWIVESEQTPVPPAAYKNQYSNQQTALWHSAQFDQQPFLNEKYMVDGASDAHQKGSSTGGASTPISAEISKLLEDVFGKHIKYHKVQ
ncbi:MAG: hypothetical protein WB588_00100, partial [Dehalococcoidia bacterium]